MKRLAQHFVAVITAALGYGLTFAILHFVLRLLVPREALQSDSRAGFLLLHWTASVLVPWLVGVYAAWVLYGRTLGLRWNERWPIRLSTGRPVSLAHLPLAGVIVSWVLTFAWGLALNIPLQGGNRDEHRTWKHSVPFAIAPG